jgi:predicted Rossmann fold flavoprotein
MPYKVEAEQRAFPQSDQAQSVLDCLIKAMAEAEVQVQTHSVVRSLEPLGLEKGFQVKTSGETYTSKRVILATGGLARPETGSTGDGLNWLRKLGLKVHAPDPSLVPITIKEKKFGALMGVSFLDCGIRVLRGGKRILRKRGKLLFAHFGLSGPLILNLSRMLHQEAKKGPVTLALDFFPDQSPEDWEREFQAKIHTSPKKKLSSILKGVFPPKMLSFLLKGMGSGDKPANQVTKTERKVVCGWAKNLELTFEGILGPDKAIVSSGGIDLSEVDFRTVQLKKVPGLHVVGDILNINRPSGGFSLQVCWSTAWAAGS